MNFVSYVKKANCIINRIKRSKRLDFTLQIIKNIFIQSLNNVLKKEKTETSSSTDHLFHSKIISRKEFFFQKDGLLVFLFIATITSWAVKYFSYSLSELFFFITILVGLFPTFYHALRKAKNNNWFTIETLISVAVIGAIFIGAMEEATMTLLLFLLGERLEDWAEDRSHKSLDMMTALKPVSATLIISNAKKTVAIDSLRPGDIIEVTAGEQLPVDGCLISSAASFDENRITGESIPVERNVGEKVLAGTICIDRSVQLIVLSEPGKSTVDYILKLIEDSKKHQAPIECFVERFCQIYTPLIMLTAFLTAVIPTITLGLPWTIWTYKGLTLLLIGCPCALVISTPAAITSALITAAKHGVLIKGGAILEKLSEVRRIAFDKTGTLTTGKLKITEIYSQDISENELLALAAAIEKGSNHPLAKAVVFEAKSRNLIVPISKDQQCISEGFCIEAVVNEKKMMICAADKFPVSLNFSQKIADLEQTGHIIVAVICEGKVLGLLAFCDPLREDAKETVNILRKLGIQGVILTGDNSRVASTIANELGLTFEANLSPIGKADITARLDKISPTAVVGDGINDAPAMKASSVSIAMGNSISVALETAEIILTRNRLIGLVQIFVLARATHANIRQNIAIAIGLKIIFLSATIFGGITGLWMAVLADTGATILVTVNALRLMRTNSKQF